VGDGLKVRFWHDGWCGEQPLKISFLGLYNIACCKDAWVANYMLFGNGSIQWNIDFTILINDREVDLVFSFLEKYTLSV
jgi:hypothetical protein